MTIDEGYGLDIWVKNWIKTGFFKFLSSVDRHYRSVVSAVCLTLPVTRSNVHGELLALYTFYHELWAQRSYHHGNTRMPIVKRKY